MWLHETSFLDVLSRVKGKNYYGERMNVGLDDEVQ